MKDNKNLDNVIDEMRQIFKAKKKFLGKVVSKKIIGEHGKSTFVEVEFASGDVAKFVVPSKRKGE